MRAVVDRIPCPVCHQHVNVVRDSNAVVDFDEDFEGSTDMLHQIAPHSFPASYDVGRRTYELPCPTSGIPLKRTFR